MSSAPRSGARIETTPTIIVGAGIAGLVIARRLALAGRRVTILEATDRVGGQLAPLDIAGTRLDAGAESFATRGGTVGALLDELGLTADVVAPEPGPAWVHGPRGAVPLPAAGFLGIPADPLAADVVRAIGRPAALRARLDWYLPRSIGSRSTTVGELVAARMGRAVLDTLVSPVARGVYSTDARDLPLASAAPELLRLLAENGCLEGAVRSLRQTAPAGTLVGGIRGGMFRLAEALAAECSQLGVAIETEARVDELGEEHVVVAGVRREGRVVLACPSPRTTGTRPITLVTLVVEASQLDGAPRGSGVLVAPGTPVVARALTHLSAKWEWVAVALRGRHALRLSYDEPPADPVATALADAATLFGMRLPNPVASDVRTWWRAASGGAADAGESVAGTGLAAVIGQAETLAATLLADSRPVAPRGRMEP